MYRYSITIALFLLSYYLFKPLHLDHISTIKDFIINALIVAFTCFLVGSSIFYILFPGTREFTKRIKNIIITKS